MTMDLHVEYSNMNFLVPEAYVSTAVAIHCCPFPESARQLRCFFQSDVRII